MKKTTIAFVNAAGNGVEFADWSVFQYNLSLFAPGTKLRVTLEHFHPQRSLKQNALLHWYCTELAEEIGMEMEDFKMMMKVKFLTRPVMTRHGEYVCDPESGEIQNYIPQTSDLDTKEMGEFTDKIRMFAQDFMGYILPVPDENYKIHFLENDKKRLKDG